MSTSLHELVTKTREETIVFHYKAAVAELTEKIKENPFKISFNIYAGCISPELTSEICKRFNSSGVKTEIYKGGVVTSQQCLVVEVPL